MIESFIAGAAHFFQPMPLLLSFVGIIIGLIVGLMPALGIAGFVAVAIPLTYSMEPTVALSLLISMWSVANNGGSITAILVNVPGTGLNAATLLDGFPMTRKGMGGRAIGAALTSSVFGGWFGIIILALGIPVAYSLIMAFGAGESLLVAVMGLTFIASLTGQSFSKGVISGLLGCLIGFIGTQGITGTPRYVFGIPFLYDGISVTAFVIGVFALPPVISLFIKGGTTLAEVDASVLKQTGYRQIFEGFKDVWRHWKLFLRSSIIGTVVGIIPGIGGEVAIWMAYAQAKQSSKHPEMFGKGTVEGVIAPETASNAKEGGSMLPTVAFGIPGSSVMALFMAALLIHGITPGPAMLREHLDITWSMVIILVFSNTIGALLVAPFVGMFSKVAFVRTTILIPIIIVTALFGAYAGNLEFWDLVMVVIFGVLAYGMMEFGYNRVAMMLGFILAKIIEKYGYIAFSSQGFGFLARPICIVLLILIIVVPFYNQIGRLYRRLRG